MTLRLYPFDDCYYISSTDNVFDQYEEYSTNYCETYYNAFMENDTHRHYEIKRYGPYLYKKYDADCSARTAVDEFIKFFIALDEYMLENE